MRSTLRRLSVLALFPLAMVACSDGGSSPTGPDVDDGQQGGSAIRATGVQMSLTGAVSDDFSAKGDPEFQLDTDEMVFQDLVVLVSSGGDGIGITALDKEGDVANGVTLLVGSAAVGEYPIGLSCLEETSDTSRCAFGVVFIGMHGVDNENQGQKYALVSGSVRITKSNDEGVEGTFSGTARLDGEPDGEAINVEGGKFGVKYLYE